jgi:3-dehydrosphinganine reductase
MSDKFQDKKVMITGGSSGIGLALAKKMVGLGSHVWILARRQELLTSAAIEIEKFRVHSGQKIGMISMDVSDYEQLHPVLSDHMNSNGVPDYLVNSAGVTHPGHFEELDITIFRSMMEINYFGLVNVIKSIIPGMIKRGSGHIINISSVAGYAGVYGYSAYGASKYAVTGLSDTIRAEMKPLGIKVSVVFPPDTDTPQHDYEKQYQPETTKNLNKTAKMLSPENVADAIISGVKRGKYIITPGFDNTLLNLFTRQMGVLEYPVMDMMIRQAMKDTGPKKS